MGLSGMLEFSPSCIGIKGTMSDSIELSHSGEPPRSLARPDGATIAYHKFDGTGPGVVFLGGFMSDMTGTKAVALESWCRERGRAFLRFDYRGHGQSSEAFTDGCIGDWADDARLAIETLTDGPQILVGSSMGGWISLLTARVLPEKVAGIVGIAAAPDFTEDLMWPGFNDEQRRTIMEEGSVAIPTDYGDDPYVITRRLIEDGRNNLVLRDETLAINCPVRLLQGMEDPDVPWKTALAINEKLESRDVHIELVKDGDHRLSRPGDIAMICRAVGELLGEPGGE